jgi:hypothetical protein
MSAERGAYPRPTTDACLLRYGGLHAAIVSASHTLTSIGPVMPCGCPWPYSDQDAAAPTGCPGRPRPFGDAKTVPTEWKLPAEYRNDVNAKAAEWGCTPAIAAARLLDYGYHVAEMLGIAPLPRGQHGQG